jgi:hypothetical protein
MQVNNIVCTFGMQKKKIIPDSIHVFGADKDQPSQNYLITHLTMV